MPFKQRSHWGTIVPTVLMLVLGLGWAVRERAFARDKEAIVSAQTVNLDQVRMNEARNEGQPAGQVGIYVSGDSPGSRNFVTGRFVLEPGKTPHAPHKHVEEEVMIIESGKGEIFCDGKTTKVGPGSVMFTTPNAPHGITNTGDSPIVFYFIKWTDKAPK